METSDIEIIKEHIKILLQPKENFIIAIDGLDGVGKTSLGTTLAKYFSLKHLDIDDYILKKQGTYISAVKYDDLSKEINDCRRRNLIISGVCLLEIMQKLDIKYNVLIYIKRCKKIGGINFWIDQEECESSENPEEKIKRELDGAYKVGLLTKKVNFDKKNFGLDIEKNIYHQKFKPHKQADIVFERLEC